MRCVGSWEEQAAWVLGGEAYAWGWRAATAWNHLLCNHNYMQLISLHHQLGARGLGAKYRGKNAPDTLPSAGQLGAGLGAVCGDSTHEA